MVWFGGDVLAVPVPVTSHPPPLSVAVVQIEVNGASSLSPSLPLVCSSRFYVSRVVIVLPTEMTIGVVLYTYLSFVYLNTCLGCLAVSTIATGTFRCKKGRKQNRLRCRDEAPPSAQRLGTHFDRRIHCTVESRRPKTEFSDFGRTACDGNGRRGCCC